MAICYPRAAGRKIERASASAIQWALKTEGLGAGWALSGRGARGNEALCGPVALPWFCTEVSTVTVKRNGCLIHSSPNSR